ncbi:MAG: TonB-dependent receptor [Betaproteobacteria bacterium]|nr:TonB-dependent receptor [Betaproteobacteria bacterium]
MREVVVSARAADGTLRTTPHSLSIITAADIERSSAVTVAELLAREANVNLQSYSGTDKQATIDIRGMGATSTSNVLVVVDGVRLNESDLSGADLASIPLSQIERIEILRGGGAVRFGDGAVGGVIHILTKRSGPLGHGGEVSARFESFRTRELRLAASGSSGRWSGRIDANEFRTDGFRRNSDLDARNAAASLRYTPQGQWSFLTFQGRAAAHRDEIGLAGPVSAAAFSSGTAERRSTSAPFDESSTDDLRLQLDMLADLGERGAVELRWSGRDRKTPYVIGFNAGIPLENQRSRITSRRQDILLRYERRFDALGGSHALSAGIEVLSADYARSENGENLIGTSTRRSGTADSTAQFVMLNSVLSSAWALQAGLRLDRYESRADDARYIASGCRTITETTLVDVDPGPGVTLIPVPVTRQVDCVEAYRSQGFARRQSRQMAVELGATWSPDARTTAFASATRHFRNPNLDELLLATTDLHSQHGTTFEAGIRSRPGERVELSATAFLMRVVDEISFGSNAFGAISLNRNLAEPTRRFGGEAELRWSATSRLAVRANVGYVVPKLARTGTDIPLVPRTTALLDLEWSPFPRWQATLTNRHTGSRYDGNDFTNSQFPRLPAHTLVDATLRFDNGSFTLTAGVRNLFDRPYATIAYSANYYPMPERHTFVACRWRF